MTTSTTNTTGNNCSTLRGNADDLFAFAIVATATIRPAPLSIRWDFGDDATTDVWTIDPGELNTGVTLQASHQYAACGSYEVALVDGMSTVLQRHGVEVAEIGRGQQLLAAVRRTDRLIAALLGAVALLSGFAILYLGNASWGSPADYIAALLWGSLGTGGLTYVSTLVKGLPIPLVTH